MATRRRNLKSVGPGDVPPEAPVEPAAKGPLTVAEAAETGDELDLLVAMKARLAKAVSDVNCPPRDLSSLTRRLQDVSREIAAITEQRRREGEENATTPDEDFSSEAL